tara:strand:- start:230 stop:472 length:243 start_codon:yes stop_codon:yes gene_type:complete
MSIKLGDLLDPKVREKLEKTSKKPLPKKKAKKKILKENKGQDAATELIAKLRSGLYRKLSDKELEAFKAEMINHLGGTYS